MMYKMANVEYSDILDAADRTITSQEKIIVKGL